MEQLRGGVIPSNLTASRVVVSDSSKQLISSSITSYELSKLDGITSNVQNQLNSLNGSKTVNVDCVKSMKLLSSVYPGMTVTTDNYYDDATGGGATYVIEEYSNPNGYTEIALSGNQYQARLLDYPTIMKIGGKSGSDVWEYFNFLTDNLYKFIWFERGSYLISDCVYYHSGQVIDFNSSSISYTGSKDIGSFMSNAHNETVSDVIIRNGIFSGSNNDNRNPFIYIYIRDRSTEFVQRILIDNMVFMNNIGSGVRIATNYDWRNSNPTTGSATQWRNRMGCIKVQNCYANNVSCGFSALNAKKVSFLNNFSSYTKSEGILFDVQCSQCSAIGNYIESPKGGVGCFGCDSPDQVIFSDNICMNPTYYHVRVNTIRNSPGSGITITGNRFYGAPTASGYDQAIEFSSVTGIEGVESDGRGTPATIVGNTFEGNGLTHSVHCNLDCSILFEGNKGALPDINYSKTTSASVINDLHINVSSTTFQSETVLNIVSDTSRLTVSNNRIYLNNNPCRICMDFKLSATPTNAVTVKIYSGSTALRSWIITSRYAWIEIPSLPAYEQVHFTVQCSSSMTVASNSEIYVIL